MDEQFNDPFNSENPGYDASTYSVPSGPGIEVGAGDNGNPPINFEYISVHDPELRGSRFNSYNVYNVTCVPHAADGVYRRYSDFDWLSDTLHAMYPGVFIPPLPPKKAIGNKSEEFLISERRPGLERFLNRILRIPILADSAPFQMFVSRVNTFSDGQSEIKKNLTNRGHSVPMAAYQYYYGDAISQPLPPTVDSDLHEMNEFLKSEEVRLNELVDITSDLAAAQSKKVAALNKLSSSVQNFYSSETAYANLPTSSSRVDIVETVAQWHLDNKESEPAFTHHFFNQFSNELYDVRVMMHLLAEREKAKSKYEKSKAKSAKWASPGAKCETEKQRAQRELDLKTEEEDSVTLDTVTKLVLFEQFKWMWDQRVGEYNNQINAFAQSQGSYAQRLYQNFDNLEKSK